MGDPARPRRKVYHRAISATTVTLNVLLGYQDDSRGGDRQFH